MCMLYCFQVWFPQRKRAGAVECGEVEAWEDVTNVCEYLKGGCEEQGFCQWHPG